MLFGLAVIAMPWYFVYTTWLAGDGFDLATFLVVGVNGSIVIFLAWMQKTCPSAYLNEDGSMKIRRPFR